MYTSQNNPWLGLASYSYCDAIRFFGRDREIQEIFLSIKESPCTVLYGVSGAGKTSMINAGLSPKLDNECYLSIPVRLSHVNDAGYCRQIINTCISELYKRGFEYDCRIPQSMMECLNECDYFWGFFHASTFWSTTNHRIIPVVFIDQFEELFTLNSNSCVVMDFFHMIEVLFSSVPPDSLISLMDSAGMTNIFLDIPDFRMVFSIREDFLPRFEDYCYNIPPLKRNRIGLSKMTGVQALDVIMKPLPGFVSYDVAKEIIKSVTTERLLNDLTDFDSLIVDTSILSLFCSELYLRAIGNNATTITIDLVANSGMDILNNFYEKNLSKLSKKSRLYLESHLLTTNGFRNQLAVEDIDRTKLSDRNLQDLEHSRIIRREIINGTERIEYTHDILCKIAKRSVKENKEKLIDTVRVLNKIGLSFLLLLFISYFSEMITFPFIHSGHIDHYLHVLLRFFVLLSFVPLLTEKNRYPVLIPYISFIIVLAIIRLDVWAVNIIHYRFNMLLWICLSFVLVIIQLMNNKRGSLNLYLSELFHLKAITSTKFGKQASVCALFFLSVGVVRQLALLPYHTSIISRLIVLSAFTSILYFCILSIKGQYFKNRIVAKYIGVFLLVFAYLLTQFIQYRWISFIIMGILISIVLLIGLKDILLNFKTNCIKTISLVLLIILSVYLTPNIGNGLNILYLGDYVRSEPINHSYIPSIRSSNCKKGLMIGKHIVMPPICDKIVSFHSEQLWDRKIEHTSYPRIETAACRIFNCSNLIVDAIIDGRKVQWDVLSHPEFYNKYFRNLRRYEFQYYDQLSPKLDELNIFSDSQRILSYLIGYYHYHSIDDVSSQMKFNQYSEMLFCSLCDSPYDYSPRANTIEELDFSGLSYESLFNAIKLLYPSKAVKCKSMLLKLKTKAEQYYPTDIVDYPETMSEYYNFLTILNILSGDYQKALTIAMSAKDYPSFYPPLFIQALIFADMYNQPDFKECLTRFVDNPIVLTSRNGPTYAGEISLLEVSEYGDESMIIKANKYLGKFQGLALQSKKSFTVHDKLVTSVSSGRLNMYYNVNVYINAERVAHYDKVVTRNDKSSSVYFIGNKRGFLDEYFNQITEPIFDHAWVFSNTHDIAVVEVDGKIGFINHKGQYVVKPIFITNNALLISRDWVFEDDGHMVFYSQDGKYGLLNCEGQWVVPPIYYNITKSFYGLRLFRNMVDGRVGVINKGTIIIPSNYNHIYIDDKKIYLQKDSGSQMTTLYHNNQGIVEDLPPET